MKWFRGLFGKKRKSLPPVPDSPETWRIGDMAECIGAGTWYHNGNRDQSHSNGPASGEVRIVEAIMTVAVSGGTAQFIGFARWPNSAFAASMFRKITPRADETGIADADFVRKLKRVQA